MAVPKRKTSPSKRGMRRAHNAIKSAGVVENQTTGELHYPHRMTKDGYYKGEQIIVKKAKKHNDDHDHDHDHQHNH